MISCRILKRGPFMTKLLSADCFDSFLLEEATIRMAVTYSIDGRLNKDFYDTDVWKDRTQRPYDLACWSLVRSYCRDCIKGSRLPASFQFVLVLKPEYIIPSLEGVPENTQNAVSSLTITIRMNSTNGSDDAAPGGQVRLVTGIAYRNFVMDKSAETAWDKTMKRFLQAKGIDYEEET